MQRRALGLLFSVLTLAFALIALAAARAGQWVIAAAAAVLGALAGDPGRTAGWAAPEESVRTQRILLTRGEHLRGHQGPLARSTRRRRDRALRDRLILTYAPLVKFVAGRLGSGLPAHVDEGDLVSYGLLGLIGAIERFDPDREIKFETYAMSRIKGAIIDELRALDWVPRSVRTRARDIERAIGELERKLHRAPTDEEIAEKLGITTASSRAA